LFEQLPLDRRLRLGLDALDLSEPTEVQAQVVPAALTGGDLRVSAETGSGKTLAYLLPAVQKILDCDYRKFDGTLALVLVPTRELARQVVRDCRALLAHSPLTVQGITGGADFKYQRSLLRKDPEIVVATPGRLREHCERGSAELGDLQTLVLDEADRMLDMGFRDDVLALYGCCGEHPQVLLLSATLRHGGVAEVARQLLRDPQKIAIGAVRQPHSSIRHQVILADGQEHKDTLLPALLRDGDYHLSLVFANKRSQAARLTQVLEQAGLRTACLHGEMSTEERKHAMQRFRDGRVNVLCASDVAARGIDVPGVDLVGASGLAVSLVAARDWNLMISIQRYLGLEFERRALPGLKARYNGPKKTKSSGKAVGSKKKKTNRAGRKATAAKRPGKSGTAKPGSDANDGFGPLRKKKI
jgi:superfamily II DNA/RNA helicase